MATILPALDPVIDWLLRNSFQAAVLAILILAINAILRRWIPASARYALLLLVAARLLMPAAPQSSWSIFNLLAGRPTAGKTPLIADVQPSGDWVITKEPLSHGVLASPINIPAPSPAPVAFD